MAKKILKRRRASPTRIFIVLIVPWIVMGLVAVILFEAGAPDYVAILAGLGASLMVIFYLRTRLEKTRAGQGPRLD